MDAVAALRAGQPVVLPTDTVYGLCADAESEAACRHALSLKGRPEDQPAALLCADVETLLERIPELQEDIVRTLLPGPYTLVFPNPARRYAWLVEETIGVRVPGCPTLAAIVAGAIGAVMATSANLHGGPDPRTPRRGARGTPCRVRRARRRRRASRRAVDGARPHGPEPPVLREGAVPAVEALAFVRRARHE